MSQNQNLTDIEWTGSSPGTHLGSQRLWLKPTKGNPKLSNFTVQGGSSLESDLRLRQVLQEDETARGVH